MKYELFENQKTKLPSHTPASHGKLQRKYQQAGSGCKDNHNEVTSIRTQKQKFCLDDKSSFRALKIA
jgi:hypothetical protein